MELPSPPPAGFRVESVAETSAANPAYAAYDESTNMPCTLLYANPGAYIIVDADIELPGAEHNPSWFFTSNGYAAAHYEGRTHLLHRALLDLSPEEHRAVIHINGIHADCRRSNLGYASQTQLNRRRPKSAVRKQDAKPLPPGIVQTDLPRYVSYYHEKCYPFSPEKPRYREFFRIEQHPLQLAVAAGLVSDARVQPIYASSKAAAVPILEKLAQAQAYAASLKEWMDGYPDLLERLAHYTAVQPKAPSKKKKEERNEQEAQEETH